MLVPPTTPRPITPSSWLCLHNFWTAKVRHQRWRHNTMPLFWQPHLPCENLGQDQSTSLQLPWLASKYYDKHVPPGQLLPTSLLWARTPQATPLCRIYHWRWNPWVSPKPNRAIFCRLQGGYGHILSRRPRFHNHATWLLVQRSFYATSISRWTSSAQVVVTKWSVMKPFLLFLLPLWMTPGCRIAP